MDAAANLRFNVKTSPATGMDRQNKYSKTSFLIFTDAGKYTAYVMTIIADSAYINNDFSKLALNSFQHRDSTFSGKLLYYTPDGKFVSGWLYKNGTLTAAVKTGSAYKTNALKTLDGPAGTDPTQDGDGSPGSGSCTDWFYILSYSDGEIISVTYLGRTCSGAQPQSPGDGGYVYPQQSGGLTPVETPIDTLKKDSCGKKTTAANVLNNIIAGNTSVAGSLNTTNTYGNKGDSSREASFSINNNSGVYSATTPDPSAIGAHYSVATIGPNTVAIGHGHISSLFAEPDAYDIYTAGQTNQSHPNVTMSIITSVIASYAIAVTDDSAFAAFSLQHPKSDVVGVDGDFNQSTSIGIDITKVGKDAHDYYLSSHGLTILTANNTQQIAADNVGYEAQLAYFVGTYKTGLSLLKKDEVTGEFKPLHFEATTVNNGTIVYTALPCN